MNAVIPTLLEAALKGTVVLAIATVFVLIVRQSSAARRYAIWFFGLAALLLLPLLNPVIPGLQVIPRTAFLNSDTVVAIGVIEERNTVAPPAEHRTGDGSVRGARDRHENVLTGENSALTEALPPPFADRHRLDSGAPYSRNADQTGVGFPGRVSGGESYAWSLLLGALGWLWFVSAIVVVSPLFFGYAVIRRLLRSATRIENGRELHCLHSMKKILGITGGVRLYRGPEGAMPMTWGLGICGAPAILIPAESRDWSDERLRTVLLHELAHIRRRDCLTQVFARCACAVYWFHPWVWIAAVRMKTEREKACDDIVLAHSESPTAYARDLVDVAGRADAALPAASAGIAMARPHKLDTRLRAILDPRRNRAAVTRKMLASLALFTALVSLPLASLQWAAEATSVEDAGEDVLDLRVVHALTGEAVPHAEVRIQVDLDDPVEIATDETGRSRVPLPDREYIAFRVSVQAEGFVPMRLEWHGNDIRQEIPEAHTLSLEPGTEIGGRFVGESGEPVGGATVLLHIRKEFDRPNEHVDIFYTTIETGNDGRWEYGSAPEEFDRIDIGVHHPDFASHVPGEGYVRMSSPGTVASLRDKSAEHVLERGVPLNVAVIDAEGNPAEGATVEIGRVRGTFGDVPERPTDANGRLRLAVHPDEDLILTVKHDGHAPELIHVSIDDREGIVLIELSPGHVLRGRVVDTEQRPIPSAWVLLDTWRNAATLRDMIVTDEAGRFEWADAPADAIHVYAAARNHTERQVSIRSGEENIIELSSRVQARLQGTVVDADTGLPVREFGVAVGSTWGERPPYSWHRDETRSFDTDDGRFEIVFPEYSASYEETSHFAVRIEADGYRSAVSPILAVADGDTEMVFELEPAEGITGRLVDSRGTPVEGAEVVLSLPGSIIIFHNGSLPEHRRSRGLFARTDAEGVFTFPSQDQEFILMAVDDSGYGDITSEELAAGQELTLHPWGRIEGEMRAGEATPLRGVVRSQYLRIADSMSPVYLYVIYDYRVETDANGRFVFDRVPPGRNMLSRILPGGRLNVHPNQLAVHVEPGETLRPTFRVQGRTIVGQVPQDALEEGWSARGAIAPSRDLSQPVPDDADEMSPDELSRWRESDGRQSLILELRNNIERPAENVILNIDGTFEIEHVEPGDYVLTLNFYDDTRSQEGPSRSIALIRHEFTVPEWDGTGPHEPVRLPGLDVRRLTN